MISINLDRIRADLHTLRRTARAVEMFPHDIMSTVPAYAENAEQARVLLRAEYDDIQQQIDAAMTIKQLKDLHELLNSKVHR